MVYAPLKSPESPTDKQEILSLRSQKWKSKNEYSLMNGMQKAMQNPYCPKNNPKGIISLGIAENRLMEPLVLQKLSELNFDHVLDQEDMRYNCLSGYKDLKLLIAQFINKRFLVPPVFQFSKENIQLQNGCNAALETLFTVICDEGDVVIVPTPYYGGFDLALKKRAGIHIVEAEPIESVDLMPFEVSIESLENAWLKAHQMQIVSGGTVGHPRALLIMSPSNPTGQLITKSKMEQLAEWCEKKKIHLVVDSIYALSVFDPIETEKPPVEENFDIFEAYQEGNRSLYQPKVTFSSVYHQLNGSDKVSADFVKERVHMIYGFSKDFCLAGFRAGVLISHQKEIIAACQNLNFFTCLPSMIQKSLIHYLSDEKWCDMILTQSHEQLRKSHQFLKHSIQKLNSWWQKRFEDSNMPANGPIQFHPSRSGFFCFLDVSYFLSNKNQQLSKREMIERERRLWKAFLNAEKPGPVYVALGEAFHSPRPGWFRIAFATDKQELAEGIKRIFCVLHRFAYESGVVHSGMLKQGTSNSPTSPFAHLDASMNDLKIQDPVQIRKQLERQFSLNSDDEKKEAKKEKSHKRTPSSPREMLTIQNILQK